MFFKVPDVVFYDSSMLRGLAEGRRKGGGRAAHIEIAFSKLVILNGIWIGGRAAEGRHKFKINRYKHKDVSTKFKKIAKK